MQWLKLIFLYGSFFFSALGIFAQDVLWQLEDQEDRQVIRLDGVQTLPNANPEALQVFVGKLTDWPGTKTVPMLGKVTEDSGQFIFQPTFPFRKSIAYTAFWNRQHAFSFVLPDTTPPTELEAIYPSAEAVPANLLKIYLHFSAPMGEGRAYENLTLVNSDEDTIYQPFVPLQPELWSEDRQRLTLWLDPGRVKRGLLSHETHGVVIESDQRYTLIIDPGWKDAAGKSIGESYRKQFRVVLPDYEKPQTATWEYEIPDAGTMEPLRIDFGESMDQALASRLLTVWLDAGPSIRGEVMLDAQESRWSFYPEAPWREGEYTIHIDSDLEDLAGNNLNRPFDREIVDGEKQKVPQDFFTVSFRIKTSE